MVRTPACHAGGRGFESRRSRSSRPQTGTTGHLFHPDLVYTRKAAGSGSALGLSGEWHGIDAMVRASFEWIRTFEVLRVEAERFIEAGDSLTS